MLAESEQRCHRWDISFICSCSSISCWSGTHGAQQQFAPINLMVRASVLLLQLSLSSPSTSLSPSSLGMRLPMDASWLCLLLAKISTASAHAVQGTHKAPAPFMYTANKIILGRPPNPPFLSHAQSKHLRGHSELNEQKHSSTWLTFCQRRHQHWC